MTLEQLKEQYISIKVQNLNIKDLLLTASNQLWNELINCDENVMLAKCNDDGYESLVQQYNFENRKEEKTDAPSQASKQDD
jgi:hypothetical protein